MQQAIPMDFLDRKFFVNKVKWSFVIRDESASILWIHIHNKLLYNCTHKLTYYVGIKRFSVCILFLVTLRRLILIYPLMLECKNLLYNHIYI